MRVGQDIANIGARAPAEQPSSAPAGAAAPAASPSGGTSPAASSAPQGGGSVAGSPAAKQAPNPSPAAQVGSPAPAAFPAAPGGSPAASPSSPAPKAPAAPAPKAPLSSPSPSAITNASPAASPSPAAGAPWPVQTSGEPPMYSATWHHRHLYSPRSINVDSNMPSYRFLYQTRRINDAPSDDALKFSGSEAPPEGWEIIPTYDAKCLVAYLMSLNQSHPLNDVRSAALAASPPVAPGE